MHNIAPVHLDTLDIVNQHGFGEYVGNLDAHSEIFTPNAIKLFQNGNKECYTIATYVGTVLKQFDCF